MTNLTHKEFSALRGKKRWENISKEKRSKMMKDLSERAVKARKRKAKKIFTGLK